MGFWGSRLTLLIRIANFCNGLGGARGGGTERIVFVFALSIYINVSYI